MQTKVQEECNKKFKYNFLEKQFVFKRPGFWWILISTTTGTSLTFKGNNLLQTMKMLQYGKSKHLREPYCSF